MKQSVVNVLTKKLHAIDELPLTLAEKIESVFGDYKGAFNMDLVYKVFQSEKKTTIRGRIYRDLMNKGLIVKLTKGVYCFKGNNGVDGIILNGDARDLQLLNNSSVHLIIADHPYPIIKGTNRNFNKTYSNTTFKYNKNDFDEKARVLVNGGF